MKMYNFFIEKNNCSPPSFWHTDASYSALATIQRRIRDLTPPTTPPCRPNLAEKTV
jgi:hypothetical protein